MILEITLLILSVLLFSYHYVTKNFDHFKKLGVPYKKPSFPFGTIKDVVLKKTHTKEIDLVDYQKFAADKFYGFFMFGKPVLSICDPEVARDVLVKDFNHFVDTLHIDHTLEGFKEGGDLDKLWVNQVSGLRGEAWKDARATFSPIFTPGKMKHMLKFMKHVGKDLCRAFDMKAKTGDETELKEIFGKYSLDSLASCAFGIDAESFTNKNSKFVEHAANIFTNGGLRDTLGLLKLIPGMAKIMQFFKINTQKPVETKFFRDVLLETLKMRKETKVRRNDLIDLMMDAMKNEEMKESSIGEEEQFDQDSKLAHARTTKEHDEMTLVATAFIMLVAGYDTTGMTLSYLTYELAKNPEVQQQLQEEVDAAFEKSGGAIPDYYTIQGLPYLDQAIRETLRLHTLVSQTSRICTKDYTFPGTNITVKKDELVMVNAIGMHMDPKYYPNPEEFNPDNFSKEARASRSPYTFLGFGQGPRSCIGMRFALLEAKVAMVMLLRRFTFVRSTKTEDLLESDPTSIFGYAKGGLWAKVVERKMRKTSRHFARSVSRG